MSDLTPETKRALARDIINSPLFPVIIAEMESTLFNKAVVADQNSAPGHADATRAALLAEVRAIRSFVSKLNLLSQEVTAPKKAPA
jgi:hypothetical protein